MPPPLPPKPPGPNDAVHDQLKKDNPRNPPFRRRLHPSISPETCEICNAFPATSIRLVDSQPKAVCLKCNANLTKS